MYKKQKKQELMKNLPNVRDEVACLEYRWVQVDEVAWSEWTKKHIERKGWKNVGSRFVRALTFLMKILFLIWNVREKRRRLVVLLKWQCSYFNIRRMHLYFVIHTYPLLPLAWLWHWVCTIRLCSKFRIQSMQKGYFWIFTSVWVMIWGVVSNFFFIYENYWDFVPSPPPLFSYWPKCPSHYLPIPKLQFIKIIHSDWNCKTRNIWSGSKKYDTEFSEIDKNFAIISYF